MKRNSKFPLFRPAYKTASSGHHTTVHSSTVDSSSRPQDNLPSESAYALANSRLIFVQ